MQISIELRILIPKRVYELLKRKAEDKDISLNDLILIALAKVVEE